MADNRKIVAARITPPLRFGDMAKIHVKYENSDTEELLFSYFADEIYFSTSELIGLTVGQANRLYHEKDVAYLQS